MTPIIFSIAILVFSIVIHEVAHGIAALYQGDPTAKLEGRITLNPIKHIDPIGSIAVPLLCALFPGGVILGWAKPVPINPYNFRNRRFGEGIVAFAGPASNFVIALMLGLIIRLFGEAIAPEVLQLMISGILINIVLAVFNLVPLPPLDGSKILYSLFPEKMANFMRKIESYGLILTIIFIFGFIEILYPVIRQLFSLIVGVSI